MSEKIRAIGVIREHLYYVCILAAQLRFAAFNCKHSAIISEWFNRTAIIYKGLKTEKLRFSVLPYSNNNKTAPTTSRRRSRYMSGSAVTTREMTLRTLIFFP